MLNQKIWVVFNPEGKAPKITHLSLESAKKEAKRLAKWHPDQNFYVMESVGFAKKKEISFYVFESPGLVDEDEKPF